MGGQPAGVVDLATRNDESHGEGIYLPLRSRFDRLVAAVVRRLPASRRSWPFTRALACLRARPSAGEDLFGV
jgi:hypothetical protein